MDFTEYGCVGVVVLTHGSENGLLWAKDQPYRDKDIFKYFRGQPTLVTKPKLLMIQAYRGTKLVPGVQVQSLKHLTKDLDEEVEPYILPVMSDVLSVISSYAGEVSTRDEIHGSWFIQTICRKINKMSPTHDLESILTDMKREVAADWVKHNKSIGEMDNCRQVPTVISSLIRKLYLRKFGHDFCPVIDLDTAMPFTSGEIVGDAVTPSLYQLRSHPCSLDHFDKMKRNLTCFVKLNPNDASARYLLDISNAFKNDHQFDTAKQRMAKAICEHLTTAISSNIPF